MGAFQKLTDAWKKAGSVVRDVVTFPKQLQLSVLAFQLHQMEAQMDDTTAAFSLTDQDHKDYAKMVKLAVQLSRDMGIECAYDTGQNLDAPAPAHG